MITPFTNFYHKKSYSWSKKVKQEIERKLLSLKKTGNILYFFILRHIKEPSYLKGRQVEYFFNAPKTFEKEIFWAVIRVSFSAARLKLSKEFCKYYLFMADEYKFPYSLRLSFLLHSKLHNYD